MAHTVREQVKQERFEDPVQEAFIGLLVASGRLRQRLHEVCAAYGITHDQYNVLRILRGVYPEGHPRYEVAGRLIERAPDVTRLLDRLERAGLVERYRSSEDRRLSLARITPKGLDLLAAMETPIRNVRVEALGHLPEDDLKALIRICGTIR
ncbi:MAG: transcriptional regulator [Rhodothermaceae bacterium]|nr:MAG: transcriptional regulator [Rhodothermaceae bacterium]